MKGKALLFGLNYSYDTCSLNGCVNDVQSMASWLSKELKVSTEVITDEVDRRATSGHAIIAKLYEYAIKSYSEDLDLVWIHYSGHGSHIKDVNNDESDGQDECLVPSDYKTGGLISDDLIQSLFQHFNPKTRVICVFDCCHSGTIGDVKYRWEGPKSVTIENILCNVKAKVITLSGCSDNETSADAFNVLQDNKYSGALTSCLLLALTENKQQCLANIFTLLGQVRANLKSRQFPQYPRLCSSYNLAREPSFVPNIN